MEIKSYKLLIRKRTFQGWMACIIFVMPFLLAFLQDFLGLPSFVKYIIDVAWVLLLALMLLQKRITKTETKPLAILVGVFFGIVFLVYLFNYQSVFYFLWGVRNNFRYYVAFFAFAMYFDEYDANSCLKFMDVLFWVNAAVSMYQFFVMGLSQDFLGGIFGVDKGCNGYSIIFMLIVVGKSVLSFFNGAENTLLCFTKCGISLIIAAMAELKFYFVVFAFLLVIASVITRFSIRKFILYFVAAVFMMFASSLLVEIFGENRMLSVEKIIELVTAQNYATTEDLGRFTAIPTISKTIFTEPYEQLLGFGIGNCDTSAFAICNTPFYKSFSYLNYTWFSSAFMYLENGIIGLTLYLLFFVICAILALKKMRQPEGNKLLCQLSFLMAIFCVIFTFYNSSLRMEVGYLAYFTLALPFVNKDNFNKSTVTQ